MAKALRIQEVGEEELVLKEVESLLARVQDLSPLGFSWHSKQIVLGPPYHLVLASAFGEDFGIYVGLMYIRFVRPEIEVLSLAVDPSWRRKGLASDLLAAALRWEGASRCLLEVHENNEAALALYKSLGFKICGRRPAYYQDKCAAWVLEKPLLP